MAEKCRICGYRFKRGDGSLCPECFTAREDELSFDGNDFKATNIFGRSKDEKKLGSFLADEMKEELHEDITIKKSLDREDTEKTRAFTAEGANVKNETFKEAFQERRSRDHSQQGRVYTSSSTPKTSGAPQKPAPEISKFLDSIDPNFRDRLYNNTNTANNADQANKRYSHHTSNQHLTSNQQMLYGINGGRAPGTSYDRPNTYNYPPKGQQKYAQGSNKAAVLLIAIIAMISIMVGVISAGIDDNNREEKNAKSNKSIDSLDIELPDISMPDIPDIDISIPDFSFDYDDPNDHVLSAEYGSGTINLLDYSDNGIVDDALTNETKRTRFYPTQEVLESDIKYREITLSLKVDGIENSNDMPVLEEMILYSMNSGTMDCISYGYDIKSDDLSNKQYKISISFLIPETVETFNLDIMYNTKDQPNGYSYIDKFSYKVLDAINGRGSDGSTGSTK